MTILTIVATLALGFVVAIVLDKSHRRLRDPEQATGDMGLAILGFVPAISRRDEQNAANEAAQVVESFRTIRMNVRNAANSRRSLTVTITSPGSKDGKSLVASNLALSFAESGVRTLLIDADLRRAELTRTFGVTAHPGLVEYLDGTARVSEVLRPASSHQNLTVLPAGVLRRRAPELLATPELPRLIGELAREFDVVVVDSPPLNDGLSSYALASATGNVALVLRAGVTDRKIAKARIEVLGTLPVRVMGAVLNGFTFTSEAR